VRPHRSFLETVLLTLRARISYVAALELRIEKLERRIAYAKSRKASVALHESDLLTVAHVDRKDSLASIRAAIHRKAARTRENSDVNSLISDFGFLYEEASFSFSVCLDS
jgi:cell division septum initiation protein DivIVA